MIYVALINGMGYGEDSEGGALQNIVGARDADFMYMGNDFIKGPGISDFASDGLKVQALSTPDNTVNIAPGGVYIANATGMRDTKTTRLWKLYSTAIENIEIPANASQNPRIDLIVAKVTKVGDPGQEGELAGSFEIVQGTPGAAPAAPAVPDDCYALAQIAVANNFTTITNANITDVRTQALISSEKMEHFSGQLIQSQATISRDVITGTTIIPFDNTIPQITEGNEFLTCSITPRYSDSILEIDVVWFGSYSIGGSITLALFRDSNANARAANGVYHLTSTARLLMPLLYRESSNNTNPTTFSVRVGGDAEGTITHNGAAGAGRYGDARLSSIVIRELAG